MILPYEVDCYICACGKKEIIIKSVMDSKIDYICSDCENDSFLDANEYNNNFIWYENIEYLLSEEFLLSLEPNVDFNKDNKTLFCDVSFNIPKLIDLGSEKISFTKKSIFEIKSDSYFNFEYLVKANFDLDSLITQRENNLYIFVEEKELINRNKYLINYKTKTLKKLHSIATSKTLKKTQSLEQFEFFLINDNLLDIDFFYWKDIVLLPQDNPLTLIDALDFVMNNRKEKTLKKSVLLNYKMHMKEYSSYNPIYIYTITRCIKDINILNRIIQIDLKAHIDNMNDTYAFYQYIEFLCSKFSEKQIEKLLLDYEKNEMFWLIDSVALFSEFISYLDEFQLSKCKFDILHEDIVKYHRIISEKQLFRTSFQYDEKFTKACTNIEDYEIKLPQNGKELYNWSNQLQNCLSGYWNLIKDKRTIVFGFFNNDELKFAVEIKDNKIVQSKYKYNSNLQNRDMNLVLGWFKEYFEKLENI